MFKKGVKSRKLEDRRQRVEVGIEWGWGVSLIDRNLKNQDNYQIVN